eukprot:TRINITY_DN4050_c0_g1_i1.p1 TRINITY_DN4050_c0_g1~~TRINITY_DN4050_c0_g1_i1.p1  ORF type:complete len:274 (-),score=61.62 TRINITY_DN4050_c0_g1_i1:49-870(-)
MVPGIIAALLTCALFYPLECIEARLQVSSSSSSSSKSKSSSGKKQQKMGMIETGKYMIENEGIASCYKGLVPTLLGSSLNWGLYFGIYKYFNNLWQDPKTEPKAMVYLMAAICAGTVCCLVINPFWVLKIRIITSKTNMTLSQAFSTILHHEGVSGFWRGVGPSLIGVSEGAVQFVVYEYIKAVWPGGLGQLMAGAISRLISGIITYPYLLLRSAMQAQGCPYSSMSDAIFQIKAKEGMAGFYKGMGPNLIRNVPPSAFFMYLVEFLRVQLFG